MNPFNDRWQRLVARAAPTPSPSRSPDPDLGPPPGFAARVVARASLTRTPTERPEEVWLRLTLRSLAGVTALALFLACLEWPHWHSPAALDPGVENTVAQVLWSL